MSTLAWKRLLLMGISLIAAGTIGFHQIPGMIDEDAGGNHLINSIYCSVMTLTTVGFGDICPSENITHVGRAFIVVLSFCGLGMFCGPVMDFSASWTKKVPGGALGAFVVTLGLGIAVFTVAEEMSELEAAYFSIITGTTIGYGEMGPKTDVGRLVTAVFAILVINVVGGLLDPAKEFLSSFCVDKSAEASKKDPEKKFV
uniref:Potassium channel domain-containing protein n=1 Tax=Helicotheca tamesis TaxID=374047 RepID=A0A7S2IBQ3_9STRA|mmetsp:Transcript_7563/g.10271  ORF Transcript_7563/g.10271 Transcript_7563/m.10271 type:complete len:200 (+) Transcript_7563:150-749(+)|eukprot:CAMPEP_0185724218 /NCGR_PEP_ID=MMETSP1171-20130828/770_1 /TAXON_ID=374046 /ORGANISM="Helicotheca tamensis, Strain CCMP826" /LENGTH=199 /DNA_ID=CAMNT_0028392021 /DNA_START=114 /DNA_END=713 /DNA_ORIENTATION=-